ncbi:FkbM family methyltransferase [Candidatus Pelagibacter sp.]|nr:FkbM family methyltransferase [Candidatus Pelagibacter sp.]
MLNTIKKKIHIIHNIYIKHKYFIKKESYSMDGEDLFINGYFKDKTKGFYVDVGCYHPIHRNNTYLLHKKGWHGVNIDIQKFSIDLFNHLRPKDLNYNFAVSNKNEIVEMFYQKKLSQLSTIEEKQSLKVFQGDIKKLKIQSLTLDSILEKTNSNNIKLDLLDIDVEGADLKVLEGFSIQKFKPELVCVEIHEKEIKKSKIHDYLSNSNYELIWSGIYSHIFRSKS